MLNSSLHWREGAYRASDGKRGPFDDQRDLSFPSRFA